MLERLPSWLNWARDTEHARRVGILGRTPVFAGLPRRLLARLAVQLFEKAYAPGEAVFSEGDPGKGLFIVLDGEIEVVRDAGQGPQRIVTFSPGTAFGELALIDDRPRSAHVIAMEDSHLLVLRREDFRKRVDSSPAVAWSLLTELSRRLRRADEKIGGLVLLDVPGRIARLLLDLAEEAGSDTIDKPLTHQTIAQMIGASRETVSRAMKDFQDANWVTVERRRITLADRTALEQRAQARL